MHEEIMIQDQRTKAAVTGEKGKEWLYIIDTWLVNKSKGDN